MESPVHTIQIEPLEESSVKGQDFVLKSFKLTLFLLKLHGYRIDPRGIYQKAEGIPFKIYRYFMLALSFYLIGHTCRWMTLGIIARSTGDTTITFSNIFYSEHVAACLILLFNCLNFKNKQVISALESVFGTAQFLNLNASSLAASIWRRAWIMAIIAIVHFLACAIPNLFLVVQITISDPKSIAKASEIYLGVSDPVLAPIMAITLEFFIAVLSSSVQVYISLIFLIIHVLNSCLKCANNEFLEKSSLGQVQVQHFQILVQYHRKISNAINAVNVALSPCLFTIIVIKGVELVAAYDIIKWSMTSPTYWLVQIIIFLVLMAGFIFAISVTTGNLTKEVM